MYVYWSTSVVLSDLWPEDSAKERCLAFSPPLIILGFTVASSQRPRFSSVEDDIQLEICWLRIWFKVQINAQRAMRANKKKVALSLLCGANAQVSQWKWRGTLNYLFPKLIQIQWVNRLFIFLKKHTLSGNQAAECFQTKRCGNTGLTKQMHLLTQTHPVWPIVQHQLK